MNSPHMHLRCKFSVSGFSLSTFGGLFSLEEVDSALISLEEVDSALISLEEDADSVLASLEDVEACGTTDRC